MGLLAVLLIWTAAPVVDAASEDGESIDLLSLTRKRERPQERDYDARIQTYELDYSYEDAEIRRRREATRVQPRRQAEVDIPDAGSPKLEPIRPGLRMPNAGTTPPPEEDNRSRNWILPPRPEDIDDETESNSPWEVPGRSRRASESYRDFLPQSGQSQSAEDPYSNPALENSQADEAMLMLGENLDSLVEEARQNRLRDLEHEDFSPAIGNSLIADEGLIPIGASLLLQEDRPEDSETANAGQAPNTANSTARAETNPTGEPNSTAASQSTAGLTGLEFFRGSLGGADAGGQANIGIISVPIVRSIPWSDDSETPSIGVLERMGFRTEESQSEARFGIFDDAREAYQPAGDAFGGFQPVSVEREQRPFGVSDNPLGDWNAGSDLPDATGFDPLPASQFGGMPNVGGALKVDSRSRDPFRSIDQFRGLDPASGQGGSLDLSTPGIRGPSQDQRFPILMK